MEQRQLINYLSIALLDMDSSSAHALMVTLSQENWHWDVIDSRMSYIYDEDDDQQFEQSETGYDLWHRFPNRMRRNFEVNLMKRVKKSTIGKARFIPFPDKQSS